MQWDEAALGVSRVIEHTVPLGLDGDDSLNEAPPSEIISSRVKSEYI